MAAVCRFERHNLEEKNATNNGENFCVVNVLCVFISLVCVLADLATDVLVFAEYCKDGNVYWALGTMIFILSPNVLINIFSMRWHVIDKKVSIKKWVTHGFLSGYLYRYVTFLYKVFKCKNLESLITKTLVSQRNDLNLLHFLYVFTGTIPQILLQSYAIIVFDENYYTKAFSLIASTASVVWSCSSYIYNVMVFFNTNFKWSSLILKLIWHFSMLIGRLSSILLFSVIFGIWMLIPLGLHWFAMTFWILTQKTSFCPNKLEETLYNVIMGFVYSFAYINLREGHTKYRLIMFYTLIVTQNVASLLLYLLISDIETLNKSWSIGATVCIIAGTLIGICSMLLYYRYFHLKGPITWNNFQRDDELNNKVVIDQLHINKQTNVNNVRTFKSIHKCEKVETSSNKGQESNNQIPQCEMDSADKKFLLEHWIARSGTPTFTSAPIGNTSIDMSGIELHTVENTPQSIDLRSNFTLREKKNKTKKKSVCSPTELTLKLSSLENKQSIDTLKLQQIQKRRGICSSDELKQDICNLNFPTDDFIKSLKTDYSSVISTESSNKKTSSDSIDLDLDLSFSDINSSDINSFNENIVQKLCLSALKNIKVGNQDADIENIQKIALDILKEMYAKKGKNEVYIRNELLSPKTREVDTPTENLSVHDYENICAVNIAREAWGLRSWNGYCDIENWLHDGSVVRERRYDTLTSGSSEISSCMSQELKNAILSAPGIPKKQHVYSNVFVKFDRSNLDEYCNSISALGNEETYLTKPYTVDSKDPNPLEPIMEELDDLGDFDSAHKKRLNSESSLVATIDEIRKSTVTNSPRQSFHRREVCWDSSHLQSSTKMDTTLENALMKEPYEFDSSNIMNPLSEKENILNVVRESKLDLINKEFSNSAINFSDNSIHNNYKNQSHNFNFIHEKINNTPDKKNPDLSNTNIDLLWQIVTEKSMLSSTENLTSNKRTSSLQSLLHHDANHTNVQVSKVASGKKVSRNRPRRKFSLLRERFEPKPNEQEIICPNLERVSKTTDLNVVNVINKLDKTGSLNYELPQQKKINMTNITTHVKANNAIEKQTEPSCSKHIVKEKRSIFMNQVLSPPKFHTKLRYKL